MTRARGDEGGHEEGPRGSECHRRGCYQRGASQRPRPPEAPAAAGTAAGAPAASATAAGTGTTAGTRAGEAAAGGMATAASDFDAAARSAGSATGMAAAAGARVGNGTRHQLRHCDRRTRAQHGRGGWPRNNISFAAVPARPFRSLCSRCAVLHSLRVSRTDLLSPS